MIISILLAIHIVMIFYFFHFRKRQADFWFLDDFAAHWIAILHNFLSAVTVHEFICAD